MNVTEKIRCVKVDKYFFRDPEGRIKNIYNTVVIKTVK